MSGGVKTIDLFRTRFVGFLREVEQVDLVIAGDGEILDKLLRIDIEDILLVLDGIEAEFVHRQILIVERIEINGIASLIAGLIGSQEYHTGSQTLRQSHSLGVIALEIEILHDILGHRLIHGEELHVILCIADGQRLDIEAVEELLHRIIRTLQIDTLGLELLANLYRLHAVELLLQHLRREVLVSAGNKQ